MPRFVIAPLFLILALSLALPAAALESAPAVTKRTTATLITSADTIVPGGKVRLALRLRMVDGWHTYWQNPGEAGVPPELAFDLAGGAVAGPISWPAPDRMSEGTITTYGYGGELILPVAVSLPLNATGLDGRVRANWLVCKDICVPEEATFPIALTTGPGETSAQSALFAAHDASVPRAAPWVATIAPDGTLFIRGAGLNAASIASASFFPDSAGQIDDGAAQPLTINSDGFTLGLHLAAGDARAAGLHGVLSVRDRGGARTDIILTAEPGAAPIPALSLAQALGFALLGGLILNLMPCVFPILAMKAVGFAAGLARGKARAHAASYTCGVLATFLALALALLGARALGLASGWGFQFASPVFVAVMAWLLFVVGLNLSGVFQVGGRFVGAGGELAARDGHWGSFFTGALAVLVATPCTAPFMGVAIAAGLAAAPAVTVLVFLVMGLGLAAPYVALSALPAASRIMPRPGPWMEIFRQFLAFPMYGAAVWLLWVVSQETGSPGVLAVATGFVLLGFAGWSLGYSQGSGVRARRLGRFGAGGAMLLAVPLLMGLRSNPPDSVLEPGVEAYTPARLAASRAAGRPVFVNLTAAWCVTCLINERVAIATDSVRRAFAAKQVVYLKGDWTRQDADITALLREQGRDGVPLYLYYAPHAGTALVLPQILTEGTVLAAVGDAS